MFLSPEMYSTEKLYSVSLKAQRCVLCTIWRATFALKQVGDSIEKTFLCSLKRRNTPRAARICASLVTLLTTAYHFFSGLDLREEAFLNVLETETASSWFQSYEGSMFDCTSTIGTCVSTPAQYISESSVERHSLLRGFRASSSTCSTVALIFHWNTFSRCPTHFETGRFARQDFFCVLWMEYSCSKRSWREQMTLAHRGIADRIQLTPWTRVMSTLTVVGVGVIDKAS